MDTITAFGLASVSLMVVTYALEARNTWFVLAFAVCCVFASAYGFLQGAWPFGVVELIWAFIAFRRWQLRARGPQTGQSGPPQSRRSGLNRELE